MSVFANNKTITGMYVNVGGDMREVSGAFVNRNGSPAKVFSKGPAPLDIVTWGGGTDKQIARMLEGHYNGEINIHDYWNVGDERVVHLQGSGVYSQDVLMVLMHSGGKTLTTPINGHSECAFIVGVKNVIYRTSDSTTSSVKMNSSDTNVGGWDACSARSWCNNVYKNAIPVTLIPIFKQHKNVTSRGGISTAKEVVVSDDYFAFPSEKEIFGKCYYSNRTAETDNSQFTWYVTAENRKKYSTDRISGGALFRSNYWTRSPENGTIKFVYIEFSNANTTPSSNVMAGNHGCQVSPFGVI